MQLNKYKKYLKLWRYILIKNKIWKFKSGVASFITTDEQLP